MRITAFIVLALYITILPGCSSFLGAGIDTTAVDEGISDSNLEKFWAEDINKIEGKAHEPSYVPPPLRWTNPASLAIYQRLAEAIILEKSPNLSEFSDEQITGAYSAIFEDPSDARSLIYLGWFSTFRELTRFMSDCRVYIHYGYSDDPIFARYKGKDWKTPHFFIRVAKYPSREFGLVITPPEPKTTEPEAQAE